MKFRSTNARHMGAGIKPGPITLIHPPQPDHAMTDLIPVEQINAVEVFTGGKLDSLLADIRTHALSIVLDAETPAGRKEIASVAFKVARSKTAIDDAGKALVADWKAKAAGVDAARKRARDTLDALKAEVGAPLDAWEAEQARIAQEAFEAEQAEIQRVEAERLAELERREAELREREAAVQAAEAAEAARVAAQRAAAEQAEREERIRAEAARRAAEEAADAVSRAERAAAQAEQDARDAEARAVAEQEAAAERQRHAVEAAERRAREEAAETERQRLAAEAAQRAEAERRAADEAHRKTVNRTALDAMVKAGVTEPEARLALTAIIQGRVPAVRITY